MDAENQNYILSLAEENVLQVRTSTKKNYQNGKYHKEFHVSKTSLISLLSNNAAVNNHIDTTKIKVVNLNGCTVIDTVNLFCEFKLRELHLSNVGLKHIPLCLFSYLEKLEVLDLSHNEINNFDIEPRCHSSLKDLRLNNNKLENLPEWILQLRAPNLEKLDYSFNKIKDMTCIFNKYVFRLTGLKMQNCYLLDQDLKFFKNIKHLQYLDISNKEKETDGVNFFEDLDRLFVKPKWKNIKILKLDNLSLSVIPNGIVWFESISEMYLTNNHLSWLPTGMEYLVNLEVIDVSNNDLTYFPEGFYLLQYIRILKAADNCLANIEDITSMKYLELLDLYNNQLEEFEGFPSSIKLIDLELNYFQTNECSFHNDYVKRLDEYRLSLENLVRFHGPHVKQTTYEPSISSSSSSDISLSQDILDVQLDRDIRMLDENWDEPYIPSKEKHPDVTISDDEWDGSISPPQPLIGKTCSNVDRLYNDEWMFCDVEDVS